MCHDDDSRPPMPLSENSGARGQDITLNSSDGTEFAAYLATPGGRPNGQVVILPDARGLHDFYRELTLRFADIGMRALAIDYFGRISPIGERNESTDYMELIQRMSQDTFRQDLVAALDFIRQGDGQGLSTFTVGFCMGGSLAFWSGSQGFDLAGVIGFYGGLSRRRGAVVPATEYASQIESPVLGLFGGADAGISPEDIERFEQELDAAGVEHEIVIYPGAPHSFFDRKAADFATTAADAWSRVQGFMAGHGLVHAY